VQQTQANGEHRKAENSRVNGFIFVERLIGQICAFVIGIAGIGSGSYVALQGHDWAGGTIASLALTGLAVVFLTGKRGKSKPAN
jgi:ABC-type proline/glycine betaine transport system permease subunit